MSNYPDSVDAFAPVTGTDEMTEHAERHTAEESAIVATQQELDATKVLLENHTHDPQDLTHDHDGEYQAKGDYALDSHTHPPQDTTHDHDAEYAGKAEFDSHNHDADYQPKGDYADDSHSHADYAVVDHTHDESDGGSHEHEDLDLRLKALETPPIGHAHYQHGVYTNPGFVQITTGSPGNFAINKLDALGNRFIAPEEGDIFTYKLNDVEKSFEVTFVASTATQSVMQGEIATASKDGDIIDVEVEEVGFPEHDHTDYATKDELSAVDEKIDANAESISKLNTSLLPLNVPVDVRAATLSTQEDANGYFATELETKLGQAPTWGQLAGRP